jgi:Polyketide cyclase / dehydrase and lipid transport
MDTSRYRNEASIVIECPAEDLYDLVADVSQMGRWSPVCTGGSYDDDGEWFTGTNAIGDSTWGNPLPSGGRRPRTRVHIH